MSTLGGYHEYIGGCSVHWVDIMMHEQADKSLSIYIENPDVLMASSRCTEHTLYRVVILLVELALPSAIHTNY